MSQTESTELFLAALEQARARFLNQNSDEAASKSLEGDV
jgi:hypothetical protein